MQNGPADPGHAGLRLRPVDEHFLLRGLVVGDRLEGDVGHDPAHLLAPPVLLAPVLEATRGASLRLLELKEVEGAGKQPLAGEGDRHPGRVDRDPPPPPLLGAERGRPGAAGGIEDEVTRIGGHEETAFDDLGVRLDDIPLLFREAAGQGVRPEIAALLVGEIGGEAPESEAVGCHMNPVCGGETLQPFRVAGLPVRVGARPVELALELERLRLTGRPLALQVAGTVETSVLGQRYFPAPLGRSRPAVAPVRQQHPARVALAEDHGLLLEELPHLEPFRVPCVPEQEVPEGREGPGLEPRGGLKADLRDEAFRPEHLVHDLPDMVQVGVRHLDEDAARRMEQLAGDQQPVADIGQERVDAELPGVAVRLHHLRLAHHVVVGAVGHVALAHERLEVRAELHRVGRVHVDGLDLAAEPLVAEQRVHHHQRVAEDHPVHPPVPVLVCLEQPVADGEVALPEEVEQVDLPVPGVSFQRLEDGRRREALVHEQGERRHVEGGPFGLTRPVEERLGELLQLGRLRLRSGELLPQLRKNAPGDFVAVAGIDDARQPRDAVRERRELRLGPLTGGVLLIPVERRRERGVVAVRGRRHLLPELRLRAHVRPEQRARLRMRVALRPPLLPGTARRLRPSRHLYSRPSRINENFRAPAMDRCRPSPCPSRLYQPPKIHAVSENGPRMASRPTM